MDSIGALSLCVVSGSHYDNRGAPLCIEKERHKKDAIMDPLIISFLIPETQDKMAGHKLSFIQRFHFTEVLL